ncbi:hypothetical protein TWF694_009611 [Orbilia ellipsospora]|uniref:Uncharacterized protein n=1 Tax=Orbilia ellipsospora TaxID=2528407 RepID=A0AAV9XBP3_9PEZI
MYDPLQSNRGSIQWSIHQVFECYAALIQVDREIDLIHHQISTPQKPQQQARSWMMSSEMTRKRRDLDTEMQDKLHMLRVRRALLKKAGEGHLWDIAKEDHKNNYRGEMLYGILEMRKIFASTASDVKDDELREIGHKVRKSGF